MLLFLKALMHETLLHQISMGKKIMNDLTINYFPHKNRINNTNMKNLQKKSKVGAMFIKNVQAYDHLHSESNILLYIKDKSNSLMLFSIYYIRHLHVFPQIIL